MSRKCFPLIFYGMKGEWLSLSAFVFVIYEEWVILIVSLHNVAQMLPPDFLRDEGWVAFLVSFRVCNISRIEGWVILVVSLHNVVQMLNPPDFFTVWRVSGFPFQLPWCHAISSPSCLYSITVWSSRCDHHGVIITVWRVSGFPCQLSWCHANASPSWFFSRCEGWVAFHVSFLSVAQITEVALCNKWSLWSTRLLTEVEVTPNITHGDDRIIWPLDFLDREQWSSF